MVDKYVHEIQAVPGRHPAFRAVVHRASASGWYGSVDGEAITKPQVEMTLEGAKSAAIARLNQILGTCGAPQIEPFFVEWREEKRDPPPWRRREKPGLGKLAVNDPRGTGRRHP